MKDLGEHLKEDVDDDDIEDTAEWEDWEEGDDENFSEVDVSCLFCSMKFPSSEATFIHCKEGHLFDIQKLRADQKWDFYECLKAINFIRRQVLAHKCIYCGKLESSVESLLDHLKSANHYRFPSAEGGEARDDEDSLNWRNNIYLTPALKNDPLLYSFEMDEDSDDDTQNLPDPEERLRMVTELTSSYGTEQSESVLTKPVEQVGESVKAHKTNRLEEADSTEDILLERMAALKLENEELRFELADARKLAKARALSRRVPPTPHSTPATSPLPGHGLPSPSPPHELPSSLEMVEEEDAEGGSLETGNDFLAKSDMEVSDSSEANLQETVNEESRQTSQIINEGKGNANRGSRKQKRTVTFGAVAEREAKGVDSSYFKSYGMFGIHREMLSDESRTLAYRSALIDNPSLLENAVVMDVGCGTGILSLFAAQAGARKVVAVDASIKISSVARQIAMENGFLAGNIQKTGRNGDQEATGRPVVHVVSGMVEDLVAIDARPVPSQQGGSNVESLFEGVMSPRGLGQGQDKAGDRHSTNVMPLEEKSVDVIVSEWMGYALLYESMLNSVLQARDKWLKPGGAILPDTATMFVAGFGKSATSLSFWEKVYGFDMSCVGREVLEDNAQAPVVDKIMAKDVITSHCSIQTLDLVSMSHDDVDFTSYFHLELRAAASGAGDGPPDAIESPGKSENISQAHVDLATSPTASVSARNAGPGGNPPSDVQMCYGLVLWFDVGFTERFCKDKPVVLSTGPDATPTHWAQTLLTFRQPIALRQAPLTGRCSAGASSSVQESSAPLPRVSKNAIGTIEEPAVAINGRISIARSARHRSIDISLETAAAAHDGSVKRWPPQMFDM